MLVVKYVLLCDFFLAWFYGRFISTRRIRREWDHWRLYWTGL